MMVNTKMITRVGTALLLVLAASGLLGPGPAIATPAHASSIITNGNGDPVDVGAWYITYNNATQWANNFGHGFPINYRPLDQNGNYNIPDSSNVPLIDFYLQQLANAKIDFILLDETNGGLYGTSYFPSNKQWVDNAGLVAQEINTWNQNHSWKIKYAFGIGVYSQMCSPDSAGLCAENQAQSVWNYFVNNANYGGPNNYYQVNGKPLLVLYDWASNGVNDWNSYTGDKTYGNDFTIRAAENGEAGTYGWQTSNGTQANSEVEVVSPGWNNHVGGHYSRSDGDYYTNGWNTVFSNPLPRIVMITSFNDYNEDTAIWTADTSQCDNVNEERWYGHDGNLHASMYWDATVVDIQKVRDMAKGYTNVVENSSFEYPAILGFEYGAMTYAWTFDSGSGVQANGSAFGAANAPDGIRTAFMQNGGTMAQAVSFSAATYTLSFQAARRGYGGQQSFDVYIDSTRVGSYSPTSTSFFPFTTNSFTVAAGAHTIKFVGTNTSGDNTDFIDTVSISKSALNDTAAGITYSGSGWGYLANRGVGDFDNDVHATPNNGDSFSYTFSGTGIAYIAEKDSNEGTADIYLDGVYQTTINAYNATKVSQQVLYSVTGLPAGSHTLQVVKTGGIYLLLDALTVY